MENTPAKPLQSTKDNMSVAVHKYLIIDYDRKTNDGSSQHIHSNLEIRLACKKVKRKGVHAELEIGSPAQERSLALLFPFTECAARLVHLSGNPELILRPGLKNI